MRMSYVDAAIYACNVWTRHWRFDLFLHIKDPVSPTTWARHAY